MSVGDGPERPAADHDRGRGGGDHRDRGLHLQAPPGRHRRATTDAKPSATRPLPAAARLTDNAPRRGLRTWSGGLLSIRLRWRGADPGARPRPSPGDLARRARRAARLHVRRGRRAARPGRPRGALPQRDHARLRATRGRHAARDADPALAAAGARSPRPRPSAALPGPGRPARARPASLERSVGEVAARRRRPPLRPDQTAAGGNLWVASDLTPGLDGAPTAVGTDHVLGISSAADVAGRS